MEERPPSTWKTWLTRVLAWGFGGLFIWAGWLKVQDPTLFLISVRSFRMLPDPYAAWLALGLPWLEIFAGLAVVTGVMRRGGLLLLNLSLVVFGVALVTALVRGLDVECGCFGGKGGGTTHIWEVLVRDVVLLAVGVWLMVKGKR